MDIHWVRECIFDIRAVLTSRDRVNLTSEFYLNRLITSGSLEGYESQGNLLNTSFVLSRYTSTYGQLSPD